MRQMDINELAHAINGTVIAGDGHVLGVNTDSRTIGPGECFFAIRGQRFDGHDFLAQASVRGASCLVVDRQPTQDLPQGPAVILVPDTTKALGDLARAYRRACGFKVIAITGSVGKTTTRHIITHIASTLLRVHQSPRNFNNQVGLPIAILQAQPNAQVLVLELGTSGPGEIAYLASIAEPDVAILTGVWPAHLQGLKDMEAVTYEKLSIARFIRSGGTFIVNADQLGILEKAVGMFPNVIGFGLSERANIRAADVVFEATGTSWRINGIHLQMPLVGPGNLANATAATAACLQLGIGMEQIRQALSNVKAVEMRAQTRQIGAVTVINDCYNANPASMSNALQILRITARPGQRRVFFCGDMAELGLYAHYYHTQLGHEVLEAGVDVLVAVGPLSRLVANVVGNSSHIQTVWFADAMQACQAVRVLVKAGDIILIKGSRAVGLECILKAIEKTFEDDANGPVG